MSDPKQLDLEEEIFARTARGDRIDGRGREIPDPTPVAPPIGYVKQPSLHEQIREMVRSERLAQEAAAAGFETFEEADDFDVGDDFDPSSPYEDMFDGPRAEEMRAEAAAAPTGAGSDAPPTPEKGQGAKPASGGGKAALDASEES